MVNVSGLITTHFFIVRNWKLIPLDSHQRKNVTMKEINRWPSNTTCCDLAG